jgi:hypothetical protein
MLVSCEWSAQRTSYGVVSSVMSMMGMSGYACYMEVIVL